MDETISFPAQIVNFANPNSQVDLIDNANGSRVVNQTDYSQLQWEQSVPKLQQASDLEASYSESLHDKNRADVLVGIVADAHRA